MSIPSRVLGSGVNQLSTVSICGDGSTSLTAAGTTRTDALQLVKVYNNLTTVASGTGVKLPSSEEGETIWITNSGANALKVYPYESTTTIAGASSVSIPINCTGIFNAVTRTVWECVQGYNGSVPILHYGSFYDTTTQTAAVINTAYAMTFNNTASQNGVSIGSPTSRIVLENTGVYNIQFSAQLDKAAGSTGRIYIWLKKNGTNVANSATVVAIQGTSAECVAAWNFVEEFAANGYFELMWSTDDTNVEITAAAASSPVPAIPSVILTVTQVNNI